MEYLTYQELKDFGIIEIEEDAFNHILPKATDVIMHVTRHFYRHADMNEDVEWRRTAFKKAIAAQVEYFYETGATTTNTINSPSQVTIGRTTVGARQSGNDHQPKSIVSQDALMHLSMTGLLYRGV